MPVIEFLKKSEINKIFDETSIKVVEYLLRKALFSQPEALPGKKQGNIQITKEFLEQWIAQGLDWKKVGSGSYPIDVYSENLYCGADVKFMSASTEENGKFTSGQSGETSLGQNFKGSGRELDQDFASKSYDKIVNGWKEILSEKIKKPIKEYDLKDIYYFIFIRGGSSISLSVAKINIDQISSIKTGHTTDDSVFIDNFIDEKYGNVKIYKAKKRMELRCLPKNMEIDGLFIKWDFIKLSGSDGIALRSLVVNEEEFKIYIKKEIERFLSL